VREEERAEVTELRIVLCLLFFLGWIWVMLDIADNPDRSITAKRWRRR